MMPNPALNVIAYMDTAAIQTPVKRRAAAQTASTKARKASKHAAATVPPVCGRCAKGWRFGEAASRSAAMAFGEPSDLAAFYSSSGPASSKYSL